MTAVRSLTSFAPSRRTSLRHALALACGALLGPVALAQNFPTKPITIIVPFAPGGTTDILARIVAHELTADLGKAVVVDNKPGAGGNIGAAQAAKARADGYTLFMGTVGTHAINAALYKKMPFDPVKDFAPLTRVATVPNLLVAHPSQPYGTVQEMIAYAKANPSKVSYGTPGVGSSPHVSGELFRSLTGTDLMHVPYKGSAPAMADLLGGQIAIMFDNMPSAIPHVRAGKLRPIAITTAQRSAELPDVPTVAEAGVPGYEATSWFGLYAPAATPQPVLDTLHAALMKVQAKESVKAKIAEQGGTPIAETPAAFAAFMQAETTKWGKVVKDSGASAD